MRIQKEISFLLFLFTRPGPSPIKGMIHNERKLLWIVHKNKELYYCLLFLDLKFCNIVFFSKISILTSVETMARRGTINQFEHSLYQATKRIRKLNQ